MTEKSKIQPQHWIDKLTNDLIEHWQEIDDFNCNCGISMSGQLHVGNVRGEIVLTNAVVTELQNRGYKATHNLILYTSDPWKGKPGQLNMFSDPKKAKLYTNLRYIDVPSPSNENKTWVDYFWKDPEVSLPKFGRGIHIVQTHELYKQKRMKEVVIELINKKDTVREILNKYRKENPFPKEWIPINPLCEQCNRIGTTRALEVNLETYEVHYLCEECKREGWSDISKGKLTWRLEWLAIWYVLNIHFEPYGKDHATPGGSRDSCIEILESVLNHIGPYGFWNEWVGYSEGRKDFGDMSGSGFIGFTPTKWLEYAEPEVLKYIYLKTPPKRRIILGLDKISSYIAEYDKAERIYHGIEPFTDPSELHTIRRSYEIVFYNDIPEYRGFQLDYQTAIILSQLVTHDQKGTEQAIQKLQATEILKKIPPEEISEHIKTRLNHARNWINSEYSPDHLRIQLSEHVSPNILSQYDEKIRNFVLDLGQELEGVKWTEEAIKQKMITLREDAGISRKEMSQFFQLLYQIFLGNSRGPRFAPFIAALDKKWVISRFLEVRNL
ncbi:MAG: lysine--tRNA ligase [Promethearchaeota archaeon]|jgi:lysyl-tRNA synthetase class 1